MKKSKKELRLDKVKITRLNTMNTIHGGGGLRSATSFTIKTKKLCVLKTVPITGGRM